MKPDSNQIMAGDGEEEEEDIPPPPIAARPDKTKSIVSTYIDPGVMGVCAFAQ